MIPQNISEDSAKDIEKIAKGASISFIGSFLGRCISFLCQLIVARSFGAEVFGLYILGLIILRITELIARFGLHTGAMRFISTYRKDNPGKVKGVLISVSLISFINGILIGGITYLGAGFISETIFHKPELTDIVKAFALCVPFMAAMMVIAAASQGFHTTKYSVYIKDIIQPLANIVFIILFIQSGFGIFWIVNAFVISHVIALLAGFYLISRQAVEIRQKDIKPVYETKKLLSYSAPLLLQGFLSFLILWTDIIMLGYMKTTTEVGIYRAASQIPIFLAMILSASNTIYAPAIAEMHQTGQTGRMEWMFKTTTRWVFYLTLPATLVFIFSAGDIMAIFGSDYMAAGAPVLIVLSVAQFINCVTGGVGFTLIMTDKQYVEMLNTIAMVFLNILLNYLLIPIYGSFGAAIATAIAIGTINLIRLLEVYIFCKIHPYSKSYIHGIISGVIAFIALYIFNKYFPYHSGLIRIISNSLIAGIIFVSIFITKGLNEEDKLLLNTVSNRFKTES